MRQEQTQGFSDLRARLDGKADKSDLIEIRHDLTSYRTETEQRLIRLEQESHDSEVTEATEQAHRRRRSARVQLLLTIISVAAAAAIALVSAVHG